MFPADNNNYDFLCGNDAKFVTVAIKNDMFHSIIIQADAAKTIDFAGGTRNVEDILLSRCLKMSQVHWPKQTGAIKRLKICFADTLAKLDVTALTSLEELSIIDCTQLTSIIGLPPSLKKINIHGTNITTLDVSGCEKLEVYNVITHAAQFHAELENLPALHSIYFSAEQLDNVSTLLTFEISQCPALTLLAIEAKQSHAAITIQSCPTVRIMHLDCGADSAVEGLSTCINLEFLHIEQVNSIKIDPAGKRLFTKTQAGISAAAATVKAKNKLVEIKEQFSEFRQPVLQPKPGPDDVETTIQQNMSPREANKNCQVTISLLGELLDTTNLKSENDIYRRRIQLITDEVKNYLSNRKNLIYYLDENSGTKEIESLFVNARYPEESEHTIIDWLENKNHRQPNILRLTESSMLIPSVVEFLATFNPRRHLMIHNHQYYRITPEHKIIADAPLKPYIERFSTIQALPVSLAEKNQFLHAALTTHHLISQSNKQVSSTLLPARQLHTVVSQFLNSVSAAAIPSTTYSASRTGIPVNPGASATSPKAGRLNPHTDQNKILESARVSANHKKVVAGKQLSSTTTLSGPISDRGSLSCEDQDPILSSKKAISDHTRTETAAQHANLSRQQGQPMPYTLEQHQQHHKPQQGKLSDNASLETDIHSAHVLSEHEAHAGKTATISSVPSHTSTYTHEYLATPSQSQQIAVDKDDTDQILHSEKARTSHQASARLTASAKKAIPPKDTKPLINAAKDLAEAMKQLATAAASQTPPDNQVHDMIQHADTLLDDTIEQIKHVITVNADLPAPDTSQQEAEVAANLVKAVRRLNLACDQLHMLSLQQSTLPNLGKLHHQTSTAQTASNDESTHSQLLDILTSAQKSFIARNRAKNLSEGIFGTGFKAGMNNMRLEILNTLISAMEDHQTLKTIDAKQSLKELMKDPLLKEALAIHADHITEHLTRNNPRKHNSVDPAND